MASLKDTDELIKLIDDDIASIDPDCESVARCTLKMVKQYIKALPEVEAVPEEQYQRMVYTVASLTEKVGELMEAEPIKHGRWIPSDKGDCTYTCSVCGFVRDAYILEEKAYCPRCGVKMFDKDIDVPDKNVGKIDEVEE